MCSEEQEEKSMSIKNYRLRILPLFEDDLSEIIDYIAGTLGSPIAADAFVDEVEKAINDRLQSAESYEKYDSCFEREYPYYTIRVKNYTIFYVVINDVMEVRRIVYSRRNLKLFVKSLS